MKFTPTWTGPYLVRSTVAGSQPCYWIARTETSAAFDAHVPRLRTSPHKTYGKVALESKVADGQGSGRRYHTMDPSLVFAIDRVLIDRAGRRHSSEGEHRGGTSCGVSHLHLALRLPPILYTDRGDNFLSVLAYKVYDRLGVTKYSGSAYRHNTSGLCGCENAPYRRC